MTEVVGAWLRLFRWKNLLFLMGIQTAAWIFAVMPWKPYYICITGPLEFIGLLVSTAAIAAAGYLINDFYDRDTDSYNLENPALVASGFTDRQVWIMYAVLNGFGLLMAWVLAMGAGRPAWIAFQLAVVGLLWFYSYDLKRKPLYGNLLIALLSAGSLLTLLLYEPGTRDTELVPAFKCLPPALVIAAMALHAFLTTLMRELAKDLEDQYGDEAAGCFTFPIVYGRLQSLRLMLVYGVLYALTLTGMILYLVSEHFWITAAYLLFIILGYSLTVPKPVYQAYTQAEWKMVSARLKLLMGLGCGGLFIYFLELCLPLY